MTAEPPLSTALASVALIDAGDGRRLERFGDRLVDRPHPGAMEPRRAPERWAEADLRFERRSGWSGRDGATEPWLVAVDGLTVELRPSESGGVGLYPEHIANVAWLRERATAGADEGPEVLHLFAHTGLLTLAAAAAGARVVHVDSARTAVAWARRNADLSGLAERPIRWLVDDAVTFAEREARRGRVYDGILLDPPSYGHAGRRDWRIQDHLGDLLTACARIAAADAFVLLTAHTPDYGEEELASAVAAAFGTSVRDVETRPLVLDAESGARLHLGSAALLAG